MGVAKGLENKIRFLGRIEHACGATAHGPNSKMHYNTLRSSSVLLYEN